MSTLSSFQNTQENADFLNHLTALKQETQVSSLTFRDFELEEVLLYCDEPQVIYGCFQKQPAVGILVDSNPQQSFYIFARVGKGFLPAYKAVQEYHQELTLLRNSIDETGAVIIMASDNSVSIEIDPRLLPEDWLPAKDDEPFSSLIGCHWEEAAKRASRMGKSCYIPSKTYRPRNPSNVISLSLSDETVIGAEAYKPEPGRD